MKRILKILMVVLMLIGIAFAIPNFISPKLKAEGLNGSWVYKNGVKVCIAPGNECSTFGNGFEPN